MSYATTCPVESSLNSFLANLDAHEARNDAINARVEALTDAGGECFPLDKDNLDEALCEVGIETLAALLVSGKFEEAGKYIADQAADYWRVIAEHQAESEINEESANACKRCGGRGCRHCNEDAEPEFH